MRLESTAFRENEPIPSAHAQEGGDVSPPLTWTDAPAQTRSFALICDDPDTSRGTWVHWVLWGIPAGTTSLAAGDGSTEEPRAGVHGRNDSGKARWSGPAPPRGHGSHRYRFHLYALDAEPALQPGATRAELDAAIAGHVLAEARLVGTYRRD